MGIFGLGYIKAITLAPQAWYQADGNAGFPDDPETLQWAAGKVWWIGVGAATGLVTGAIKVVTNLDEYPSFIVDVRERQVDPWMSVKVSLLTLVSEIGGASLGPEAGLGAAGAMFGQLTGNLLSRYKIFSNIDIKLFAVAGICAAFSSIFPSPLLSILLTVEIGVPLVNKEWNGASPMHVLTLFAATSISAYAVYYSVDEETYLSPFALVILSAETLRIAPYDFAIGMLFGVMGAVLALIYMIVGSIVMGLSHWLNAVIEGRFGRSVRIFAMPILGGTIYGALMYVFPLTVGSGSIAISPVVSNSVAGQLSPGLLVCSSLAKMVAYWICRCFGLVGGLVFPMLLIGTTMGQVFAIWTGVNEVLAISAGFVGMTMAMVPAPFSFCFLAYFVSSFGQQGLVPITACAFVAYLCCVGLGIPQGLQKLARKRAPPGPGESKSADTLKS